MVLASFAADTLSLGAHWIYDTGQISRNFGEIRDLLPPHRGGYHPTKQKGEFTHYGDQSFLLLKHLAGHRGRFNSTDFARDWQLLFSNYRGYTDQATKTTLKNMESSDSPESFGSPSNDLGGAARIAPLIYCYRDDMDKLVQAVKDQTAITHTGSGIFDGALFIARSCHFILHGATLHEAFTQALDYGIGDVDLELRLSSSIVLEDRSVDEVVKEFGQMCSVNAALPGAVFTALHSPYNLEEALVETVMAGGDSAARGMVVGMILGAHLGERGIPERWLRGMVKYREIEEALDELP